MSKGRFFWLAVLSMAVVLTLSTGAMADSLTLTGVAPGIQNYYGEYAGLYQVTVNGVASNLICDDGGTNVGFGQTWNATEYAFNSTNASHFKFWGSPSGYNPDPLLDKNGNTRWFTVGGHIVNEASTAYTMAAWLALKIFQDPTNSAGQWGAVQWAIWSIFNNQQPDDAAADNWLLDAYNAVTTGHLTLDSSMFANLRVFVPDPHGASQEFFGYVPEPATMILLGTGLLGLGAGRKKLLKVRG